MRGKARKRDARQCQRVDPDVADVDTAFDRLDKRTVKGGVMRNHRAAADKIGESGHGIDGRWGIHHIGVCNAREFSNLGGDQLLGMHEGIEPIDNLAARKAGRRYLDKLVVLHRKTRGLGIEDDNIFLDETKRLGFGTLGKCGVGIDDKLWRSRRNSVLD